MVRLTRAQQRERTQAAVLAAAGAEFAEHGFVDAKIDRIAERAELTRGAVYSNFPAKRALYLAVLVDLVGQVNADGSAERAVHPVEALGGFARAWLERIPLTGDTPASGHLQLRSLVGVLDDERVRTASGQVTRVEALLLGLALESVTPSSAGALRRVRLAETVLTLLNGVSHLAETAPGFGDPFDALHACEHLAGLDFADVWDMPHLPYVGAAQQCDEPWVPPEAMTDEITGGRARLDEGVIAVLGTDRLQTAEEAVRACRPGDLVTIAVVTNDPDEVGRLVRLRISDLMSCLRRAFPPSAWPRLQLVLDDHAVLAAAAGVPDATETIESAVRVADGTIAARAHGPGAAHAAATAYSSGNATAQPNGTST